MQGIDLVREPKSSRAVLLFHGLTGTPTELIYLARSLHARGFDVFCPTLPGHLGTREDVMRPTWRDWMAFAKQRYDDLAARYESISVGGVCVGGVMAVALSTERKAASVVCLAPIMKLDGWSIPWYSVFSWFPLWTPMKFLYVFPEGDTLGIRDEKVRQEVGEKMGQKGDALDCFPLMCVRQLLGLGRYMRSIVKKVSAPLLVMHSVRDDLADISTARYICERASSEQKEFHAVQDSYHLITLDRDREFVNQTVTNFLGRLGA